MVFFSLVMASRQHPQWSRTIQMLRRHDACTVQQWISDVYHSPIVGGCNRVFFGFLQMLELVTLCPHELQVIQMSWASWSTRPTSKEPFRWSVACGSPVVLKKCHPTIGGQNRSIFQSRVYVVCGHITVAAADSMQWWKCKNHVSSCIKHLKPSKGLSSDGNPSVITKGCSHTFILSLVYGFNISLSSQTFPSLWKTSVIPLYKKRQQLCCH